MKLSSISTNLTRIFARKEHFVEWGREHETHFSQLIPVPLTLQNRTEPLKKKNLLKEKINK